MQLGRSFEKLKEFYNLHTSHYEGGKLFDFEKKCQMWDFSYSLSMQFLHINQKTIFSFHARKGKFFPLIS